MLERSQVQCLSNRDAVVSFFEVLGYNVSARLKQSAANLGISPESTVRRIRHIERIANQEDYFQVYLFEVDSVTVDLTRSLARTFRDFQGHYLLVITSDYEQIDFVLVETLLAGGESPGPMQAQRKRGFRPLGLSVKRRAPGRVDLRVLARFEYTEADPQAQYEKLLSAYSVAFWSEEHFNNRALFSDYYLVERLRDLPEWKQDIAVPFEVLHGLLAKGVASFAGHPEVTLRSSLFLPAFEALGFVAKEQKKATDDVQKPDYALYAGDAAEPVTLALTYCWNRNLDGPDDTRDPGTPQENPSQTVITVLENSPCDWAIVTNGKIWRLYSKKAHSRATNYYEVDLPEILALPDSSDAFRYFWLFLRAAAFIRKGESESKKCFLDELLDGSQIYAKKLGERLKDRVFREIFPHFASGFVAGMGGPGKLLALPEEERASRLGEHFQGTLTFLYRLLFLSYAEARDLLPVKERRGYYLKSLLRMKEEVAEKADRSESTRAGKIAKSYGQSDRQLYDRLTALFALIDKGDPSINLPTYNGGLFMTDPVDGDSSEEAAHARFLRDHFIPDQHLAMGLDLLARVEDEKKLELVYIDYKSLGVRQLGSIYEGLLEFKVEIATEKLGVVKQKGKDVYCPWRELSDREHKATERRGDVISKGDVYLSNDKSERKATGSYYTPDYIVEYIVEHAVGPVLQEKFDSMRPKLREAQKRYRESVELNLQRAKAGSKIQDPDVVVGNTYVELAEELFDLKVLDPAMGSGHFLVEVVDCVTDRMIDFLNGFPWNPVAARLRRMRESILEHMDESGINIDHARLTDTNLLKRHVLKRCIYGVDINPMAVELAKVSLWLDCFTLGAPLSFLDHHLKCGNSLIGTDIETVKKAVETDQLLLFSRSKFAGVMLGADLMRKVGRLSDVTVEQMNQSRHEFKRARDELAPYKRLLDVYVSRWFGNTPVKESTTVRDRQSGQARKGKVERDFASEFLLSADAERWAQHPNQLEYMDERHRQIAKGTIEASKAQRFFHWELEFPEVYYGPRSGTTQVIERLESAGFDVVVGNPPYGKGKMLSLRSFIFDAFPLVMGESDMYVAFMSMSCKLGNKRSRLSLIVPDTWLTLHNCAPFRRRLLADFHLIALLRLNENVFEDPTVDPLVYVLGPRVLTDNGTEVTTFPKDSDLADLFQTRKWTRYMQAQDQWLQNEQASISIGNAPANRVCLRNTGTTQRCADVLDFRSGCKPYELGKGTPPQTEKDIREEIYTSFVPQNGKRWSPLLRGDDIGRYFHDRRKPEWIKYGDWLAAPREEEIFEKPRLLVQALRNPSIHDRIIATYADERFVTRINVYTLLPKSNLGLFYCLALLNSKLMNFLLRQDYGLHTYVITGFERLPIRSFTFNTPVAARAVVIRRFAKDHQLENLGTRDKNGYCEIVAALFSKDMEASAAHDLLSFLAEEMSNLNRRRQVEMGRALKQIEKVLRICEVTEGSPALVSLTGKSRLQNYLGDYRKNEPEVAFAEFEKILFKNRSRLGVSLSDAGLIQRLRDEYEKSLATLLPIKQQLAATDTLIDQIVYRLYGLIEKEIAIVEGKADSDSVEVASRSLQYSEKYTPVARDGDPLMLREVIAASALLGPASVAEVAANVEDRAAIQLGFDKTEDIVREFTRLGWMTQGAQARVSLSETGTALAKGSVSGSPYEFARDLALAHEKFNDRIISRILGRLWELNSTHQGAVIIPRPQLPESVPVESDAVEAWIEAQTPKWLKSLEQQMPGFIPALPSARFVSMVKESAGDAWPTKKKASRDKERLQKAITQQFMHMMFGNLRIPMRDLDIWQSRLDWAGLTMTARNLPGVAGWVWFPVGAFRDKPGEGFRLVEGLIWQKKLYYVHEPEGAAFETQFMSTLYGEYYARQQEEGVEYVSLPAVRDRVCYKLRIGAGAFEKTLAAVFPKAIRGDLPYGMALEVDITPTERSRLGTTIPIVIDGTPRYIIAIRKK